MVFGAREFRNLVFSTMSFSPAQDKGRTAGREQVSRIRRFSLRRRCPHRSGPEVDEKRSASFTMDGHSVVRSILLSTMI
jgi:hypothetical protein